MHEQCHLVALDNRFNHDFSHLHSTTIYPKSNHTLYGVLIGETKNSHIGYTFALSLFLFFSFFFSKLEHLIHLLATSITMNAILLHHLDLDHPNSSIHLDKGLVQ
jgi:hypothetical protein